MSNGTSISSGLLTASTAVYEGRGILSGVHVTTDGTNNATVTVYDGTAASGNELFKTVVTGTDNSRYYDLCRVRCTEGLYAEISGTGASAIVYHGA